MLRPRALLGSAFRSAALGLVLVLGWPLLAEGEEARSSGDPQEHDGKGFRVDSSAFVYYSISDLKTNNLRMIVQLSTLDMYEDIEFETGVGVGLLLRPKTELTSNSLGLAVGAGYNLMADESEDGWFAFVGFSWNFDRKNVAKVQENRRMLGR